MPDFAQPAAPLPPPEGAQPQPVPPQAVPPAAAEHEAAPMPMSPTRMALEQGIKNATRRIGRAITESTGARKLARLRVKRAVLMNALAVCYKRYTLINGEGMTEFVDKDEYEQRVVAWARRRGLIPRAPMRGANVATPPPPIEPSEGQPPVSGA